MQRPAAERLADELELAALPACQACLFELAWAIHLDRPRAARTGIATRIANCVWFEIEDELRAGVVGLRMRELPDAETGLHDLADRAHRGMLCRVVVERLAEAMAEDIRLTAS